MTELGERLVDAITAITGVHPGYRVAHAQGVCATGTFTASQYDVGAMMEGTPTAHFNGVIGEITTFVVGVSGGDLTTLEANQKTYFATP